MSTSRRRLIVLAALTLLVLFTAMGCSGGDEAAPPSESEPATAPAASETESGETGDRGGGPARGATVFEEAGCGNCHTLAAADSSSTVGPNLDDAKPSFELVVERVTNGASPMPAFGDGILDDQQIDDVAAYVVQSTQGAG
jgi:mono/diheme cytochrome c family protein